ncbi:DUF3750 domain-containing protein [Bradyrhizobium sp. LHD-71]|uniref:DUF3750 domain-containing protein n=1 Tax=Bradyrhizobium sp. LHD-71 TaxID=3072141 RepID=UPI00280FAAAE|nr:DUF3750 domain-containing protein [Bradyrhizobium sp. LHD-71]MDQ8730834.1 DUF3750 domain-containing protein [Bradyrhizobium sp. LHD-71]
MFLILFVALIAAPIAVSATLYAFSERAENWQIADRSSAGLLAPASAKADAAVRIFAARTVRWRGIFAVHSWIVFKDKGESVYTRYDYTAWGEPIRVNGFAADGRWFGEIPETVFAADGPEAEKLIPKIRSAIAAYEYRNYGDYRAWPGPNSNTFIAAILNAVPQMRATLPPTAIGKDFPYNGSWLSATSSGFRATLGGYLTLTVGWIEGIELSLFGGVIGLDVRRPAIKLPALGRIGMSAFTPS